MAKIKFDALAISNLKPQKKVVEYFEDKGGFGIRVQPSGTMTWFVLYRSPKDGKVKRKTIGTYPEFTVKAARKEAKKIIGDISRGADPRDEEIKIAQSDTFGAIFEDYMTHHARPNKAESSVKTDQWIFDKYLQEWKATKASMITRRDIIALHRKISADAPVMANRVLALISTVFSKAIQNELIDATPCVKIRAVMAREAHRERILSDDEIRALWAAFDTLRPNMRDILKLILLTAQRPGEVQSMTVDELDPTLPAWTIPASKTKNRRRHVVPLTPQAMSILKGRISDKSPWIFPSVYNDNKSGHATSTNRARQVLKAATGVKDWTAHDLRRTARTLMARFGVPPHVAERVLNHSEGKMARVYDAHDYLDEKRDALARLADGIDRIISAKE